jgi:hypothetical protein
MAYTTIDKGSEYFNTVLYTGNSGLQTITGVGFQPDLVWFKSRSGTYDHALLDAVRAGSPPLYLSSNTTAAEAITGGGESMTYNSDGFTFNGNPTRINFSGETYVAWNWLGANTTVSNTDGSITSTVSANTTSGFSIVSWAGNQTAGASCGHGLGVVPKMIIKRRRNGDGADDWYVYTSMTGNSNSLYLNNTSASAASGAWNSQTPTSTVFYHGSSIRENGNNMIAYCFAEVKGYSKMGSYIGNGSSDGTFVYTGFKPAFVMVKQTNTVRYWVMFDNKRDGFNPTNRPLFPNASDQESNSVNYYHDILSNGFKWRTNSTIMNESGGNYIYMAFAENPFVTSTGIPTTAR